MHTGLKSTRNRQKFFKSILNKVMKKEFFSAYFEFHSRRNEYGTFQISRGCSRMFAHVLECF